MAAWSRSDERGQVVSSVVALAAVVAVVVGLLVLFGTGGTDGRSVAQPSTPPPPVPSPSDTATSAPASTTVPTTPPPVTTQAPTPKPTTASSSTTIKTLEPVQPTRTTRPASGPRPSIEIYNNTTQRGLADRVSTRARAAGWTVAGIDNWIGKVAASTVYYPPAMADHAAALAADLGVSRTKGALDNMKTDRLTVILTTDYTG